MNIKIYRYLHTFVVCVCVCVCVAALLLLGIANINALTIYVYFSFISQCKSGYSVGKLVGSFLSFIYFCLVFFLFDFQLYPFWNVCMYVKPIWIVILTYCFIGICFGNFHSILREISTFIHKYLIVDGNNSNEKWRIKTHTMIYQHTVRTLEPVKQIIYTNCIAMCNCVFVFVYIL